MTQPTLHFRPLRPAVAADGATTLDLLITVTPPEPPADAAPHQRPALNLALVIDRSGSMAGSKLSYARKAARFLVSQLTKSDRLAIVTFDSKAQVVVSSTPVADPLPFIAAINTIHRGGSTALFDGWLAGAQQVAAHLDPTQLNRVLLLSDGQANRVLSDTAEIAARVAGLTQHGVSTSAFGLGRDFDEDLMGAVARAGDGTLAHIESPSQLADLYASELQGLATTFGRRVSIGLRAKHGAELVDVLNDLPTTEFGNFQWPNLSTGQELNVGLRLQLPAWTPNQEILSARLAWDAPGDEQRQKTTCHLSLPVVAMSDLRGMEEDTAVAEQLALLHANQARRKAIEDLDRGDVAAAISSLDAMDTSLAALMPSELIARERALLAEKKALLGQDRNLSRKRMSRESMRSSTRTWEPDNDVN